MSDPRSPVDARPLVLGWGEWVALPDLGLPAVKAKVDTGARTSALHAFLIEPFGPASQPMVRFGIHPIPGRSDIEIYCSAPVVDRREVTSSNGEREVRFVIGSRVEVSGRSWPIEITLTNRETMAYRMLLGRQAIREDVIVDPSSAYRQPRLSYKLYRHLPRRNLVNRTLRIALVTSMPERRSNLRLAEAASARGHVIETIDTAALAVVGCDEGLVSHAGSGLQRYDVVVPRIMVRDGALAIAAVRALELTGATSLNPASALERLRVPLATVQHLAHAGLPVEPPLIDAEAPDGRWGRRQKPSMRRYIIIGGRVAAAMSGRRGHFVDLPERRFVDERRLAEAAARHLDLSLAQVDFSGEADEGTIARISAAPALGTAEATTGARLAEQIVAEAEARARSWIRRGTPDPTGTSAGDR